VTHAEENAITEAGRPRVRGCTIYVTDEPCDMCWPRLRGAGLKRVVWFDSGEPYGYSDLLL
jgi:tRNA(Arg) A34 adenosine deaminase TadA